MRLHFHDWSLAFGGEAPPPSAVAGTLLLPGLLQPAWSWATVARRLGRATPVVVADLRGQGLSDAPMEGYDLDALAADAVAVAEGSGLLSDRPIAVAGTGRSSRSAPTPRHPRGTPR